MHHSQIHNVGAKYLEFLCWGEGVNLFYIYTFLTILYILIVFSHFGGLALSCPLVFLSTSMHRFKGSITLPCSNINVIGLTVSGNSCTNYVT